MFYLLCGLLLIDALRLRGRAKAIPRLDDGVTAPRVADVEFFLAPGVVLSDAARSQACAYLENHGLAAVDLWPETLSAPVLFSLFARFDAVAARKDRLAPFAGPGHAVAVRRDLLERMGTPAPPKSVTDVQRIVDRARDFATSGVDAAVVQGMNALPERAQDRRELLSLALHGRAGGVVALQVFLLGIVLFAFGAGTGGMLFLVLFHAQVMLALAGTPFAVRAWLPFALLRVPWEFYRVVALIAGRWPDLSLAIEEARPYYTAALAGGLDRFIGPRRETCPACGGTAIRPYVTVPDLHQNKPGMFTVDHCPACDHFFANPAPTDEGLAFYYRDYYDGPLARYAEEVMHAMTPIYLERARAVMAVCKPSRWLDVGTGQGHFPCVARDVLPGCRFDGLDWSVGVDEAARRGWIAEAHRGSFVEFAARTDLRWDVVSMSHYLEHCRDPLAELQAAARVLPADGRLFIEIPSSESRLGRALGWTWIHWAQPQHLHLPPLAVLTRWLDTAGFDVEVVERNAPHRPFDLLLAVQLFARRIAPDPNVAWRPPARPLQRLAHGFVGMMAASPTLMAGALDLALIPLLRAKGWTNGLWVVARRRA